MGARFSTSATVAALLCAALACGPVAASAAPDRSAALRAGSAAGALPYTDPGQVGLLTLCNARNQRITHGSIRTQPFVARVVSDVPAPTPYDEPGRTADLYAYQPRPYTPAGAWSGEVLAAASEYSNPAHPMAQLTPIDDPLDWFTEAFPPIWDHLVELRLYLGLPGQPQDDFQYAAADLRVTGTTWTVVEGGTASCSSGEAISRETLLGLDTSPHPTASATVSGSSASAAAAGGEHAGSPTGAAAGASPGAAGSSAPAASATSQGRVAHSSSSTPELAVGLVAAALVVIGAGGLWRRRRRGEL